MPAQPRLLRSACGALCPHHRRPCSSTHGGTRPGLFSVAADRHLCADRWSMHPF